MKTEKNLSAQLADLISEFGNDAIKLSERVLNVYKWVTQYSNIPIEDNLKESLFFVGGVHEILSQIESGANKSFHIDSYKKEDIKDYWKSLIIIHNVAVHHTDERNYSVDNIAEDLCLVWKVMDVIRKYSPAA